MGFIGAKPKGLKIGESLYNASRCYRRSLAITMFRPAGLSDRRSRKARFFILGKKETEMSGLKRGLIGIAIIMGLVNSPQFSIAASEGMNEPPRKTGEILVKLRASGSSHRQNVSLSIDTISAMILKEMQPVFSAAPQSSGSNQKQLSPQNSPLDEGLSRWFTVSVKDEQDLQKTLDACATSSLVEYAEPIYI
jgi:hypothetical protein